MSSIKELALAKIVGGGGGGGDTEILSLNVTQNGTYNPGSGKAYKPVNVNVPNSYGAGDEGKVVSGGALVAQTSKTVTANGTVDTTTNDEVVVNVPSSQPNLQSKTVNENGTVLPDAGYDGLSSVVVDVSGGGIPGVPSDYQEVEYLQSDGNAYTAEYAVKMQTGDIIQGHASLDSSAASSSNSIVFGGGGSSTCTVSFYQSALIYGNKLSGTPIQDIQYDTKYEFRGVLNSSESDFVIGRNSSASTGHKGKIWTITIMNGRTEAAYRCYVPCYRKSDNKPGFFEVIRGVFKTSSGSSDFIVGPDVT